tara:strand:+ start:50 stop:262 length:213 start_codon:yes stop_codon:yes gene_type:complete
LSGKPSLYVNPGFTIKFEGMTQMESQPFLNYLYLHAMNKSIMHRFQWEKDSVILWVREKKTKKKDREKLK